MAKTWNIYRYDQPTVARATVHELEYHGSWMEDEYVIVSVRSAEPVDFHYGDHLYYRGTRYDINYDANVIKKARSGSYGEGFTYDSIKLYSIAYRLKDCGFKDVVLNEVYDQANKLVYSSQGKFSFFASSVEDLADRIKANINRFFGSGNTWKVYTPDSSRSSQRNGGAGQWSNYYDTPASYGKTDLNISVEDISCYDALKMAYTEFELSFYLNGQDIVIGGKPITADYDFEYGKGNGLYEIERTSDDSQRIVTKLFAYGSEKNLPLNYYANLHKKAYITGNKIQWQIIEGQTLYSILTGITQTQVSVSAGSIVNVTIGGVTVSASLDFRHGVTGLQPDGTGWSEDYDSPLYLMLNLNTDIKNANAATIFNGYTNGSKIYINNGINLNTWPTVENTASNYPALLSINRLMLPGFPDMSLYTWVVTPVAQGGGGGIAVDASTGKAAWKGYTAYFSKDASDPWIKSVNANTIGVREGTANFDSDEDEIYPSIEGTGYDEVLEAEQIADNGYLDSGNDDDTFTLTPATVNGDDGGIEWNYSTETVSISMKDGYCVGREFQVEGAEKDGDTGQWTLKMKRQADSSLGNRYFPYKEGTSTELYQVKQGDKFVILGIPLPKSFVDLASKKLLEEALKHLATIDHQKYTYIPRIDEIEMQRQDDIASQSQGSIVSVHDTICAGMQMQVTDEDLGIDYSPFIDNITIKENGNNGIPTYDVVLKDEKEMTTLERIQSEVRGGRDAVLNAMDGLGDAEYLSRKFDDTAQGFITFMKGLQVSERFVSGLLGQGGVFRTEDDGTTYIEADKLYIRVKAYFDTVEIRKYMHSSGNRIASCAGMKCIRVVWFDSGGNVLEQKDENLSSTVKFRCFFRAFDGDNKITNDFVVGDMAYCHITNAESSTSLYMHHFWRLVVGVSSSPDTNGEHWIDLSNKSSETLVISSTSYTRNGYQADSDVPVDQDDIIQLGNIADSTRRGAIIEYVSGADAPSYQIFQGIGSDSPNPFVLTGKNYISMGYASGNSSLHSAGHAYLEVMGDFYFGDINVSSPASFIKYNSTTKQLDIKANVTFTSPTTHQDTTLEEFANAVTNELGDIQAQIDGQIESWFYDYMPVAESSGAPANRVPLTNKEPYKTWYEADHGGTASEVTTERTKHLGDTFYDNTSGYAFRFSLNNTVTPNVFEWVVIEDSAVIKALADAAAAQDTADHKRRVFLDTPVPPYDAGDLWVNAVYPATGTKTYDNDILRCRTAKAAGESFSILDWTLASRYTDDTLLHNYVTAILGNQSYTSGDEALAAAAENNILDALDGATVVDGGLMLTSLIAMRKYKGTGSKTDVANYDTWGGISGLYKNNETGTGWKGHGIAAWYGGLAVDKECIIPAPSESSWDTYKWARSLFRFDGSGYVANGNISWDKSGTPTIKGYVIDTETLKIGGNTVNLSDYVTIATDQTITGLKTFNSKIKIGDVYLEWESANNALKVYKMSGNSVAAVNLYATGGVSALGIGSGGGGGGSVTLNEPLNSINTAGLSLPSSAGATLVYNGTTWTYSTLTTLQAMNLTVYGNATFASSLTANGITINGKDNTYVVLAGGGTKLLSEIGGGGGTVNSITIGNSSTQYTPDANGNVNIPAYPSNYVTGIAVNNGSPISPTGGIVSLTIPTKVSDLTNDSGFITGYTDTKNTAGATDLPSVKLYLIGANGQTANPQTYTNTGCYISSDGYLYSGGSKVLTSVGNVVTTIALNNSTYSPQSGVVSLPAYPSKTSDLTNDSGFITGYTDTKNTAGATDNVNTKLFLIGSTAQSANPQTYSNQSCYIGSDNCLYSGGSKVMTAASGYLPLTGGTMTGMITGGTGNGFEVKSNTTSGYWTQGIRVYDNSGHYSTIALCDSNIQNVLALVLNTNTHEYYIDVNVSGTNYRIDIPQKAGTMALTSDIPTYTDTKNTAGATNLPNVKLYLVGANGQTANPQTYTNTNLYLGSDGVLNNTAVGDAVSIGSSSVTTYSAYLCRVSGRVWAFGADYSNDVFYLWNSYTNGHVVDISNLGAITAYSFVRKNGTSAQFLKADGSVDSNTYLTTYTNTKNTAGATNNTAINLYLVGAPSQSENPETYTRSGIYISSAGALVNTNNQEGLQLGNDTANYSCVTYRANSVTWAAGNDSNHFYFWNSTANDQVVKISASGTLSVGNVNAGNYKVAVNGSIICTSVTQTSDVRNKDIIADKNIELWQVAQAPIFTFTWKDKELGYDTHVGTSAQYWKSIVPEAVQQSGNGYLGMQYDVVALLAAVTTAKKVQDHEMRIQALERENEALKNELSRLKAA